MKKRVRNDFKDAKDEIHFIDNLKEKVGIKDIIALADFRFEN